MWILTTKGYGMMLPSRLHWATSRRLGADILHGHEMEIARLEPDEIARYRGIEQLEILLGISDIRGATRSRRRQHLDEGSEAKPSRNVEAHPVT